MSRIKNSTEFLQALAVGNQGLLSIIGLARTIVVARLLTPTDYGVMGVALAVGGIFSIFQNLGLGVGVAKEAAQNPEPGRLGIVTLLVISVRMLILIPLLAILVFVVAPNSIHLYKIENLEHLINLYALFILVSSPGDILGYALTGAGKFRAYFRLKLINEVVLTITVCTMIYWMKIEGYFLGQIIAATIYTGISFYVLWRFVNGKITKLTRTEIRTLVASILKTSTSTYTAKLCRSFSLQAPILLAGYYLTITAVGWLKFGMQAGGYVATIISAAQVVTLPKMISYLKTHGQDFLFDKFSHNFRRLSYVLTFILILAVMFAPEAVRLVGGSVYLNSVTSFQLIVIYYILVVSADTIFAGVYFPLDREISYVKSYISYFFISTLLGYFLLALFKTTESSLFGICIGSAVHLVLAVAPLKNHEALFKSLTRTLYKQAFFALLACTMVYFSSHYTRFLPGIIGLLIISIDIMKSEPKLFNNLYLTAKSRFLG